MALLSTIKPDFIAIRSQFIAFLSTYASWQDSLISSTGQMVIDFVAGMATYNQFGIERAAQEVFLETAIADSSVYTIARLLGVKIQRLIPANVTVQLDSPDISLLWTIPAYSNFTINGLNFYNRTVINIPVSVSSVSTTLYQGSPTVETFSGTGQPFQIETTGTSGFVAADTDVRVSVDAAPWDEIQNGLWLAGTDELVFYQSTTQDGRIEVLFGNSIYGAVPTSGANNIRVDYFITNGSAANNAVTGFGVTSLFLTAITGITTSAIAQGQDTKNLNFYRYTVPRTFASGRRIVTRDDGKAIILTYPNVVVQDVNFIGEHELGPSQVQYQNTGGVILLTAAPLTPTQKTDFLVWIDKYKMSALNILLIDPVPIPVTVHLDLIIDQSFDGTALTTAVSTAVSELFAPQLGTIGKSIYLSDIYKVVMEVDGVVHCDVNNPTLNLFTDYKSYVTLNSIVYDEVIYPSGEVVTVNTGGNSVVQGRVILQPEVSQAIPLGVTLLDVLLVGDGGRGGDSFDNLTDLNTGGGGQAGAVKRHSIALDAMTAYSVIFTRDIVGNSVFTLTPGAAFTALKGEDGTAGTTSTVGVGGGGGIVSGPTTYSHSGTNILSPPGVVGPGLGGAGSTTPVNGVASQSGQLGECIVAWGTATTTSVAYADYAGGAGFNGRNVAE